MKYFFLNFYMLFSLAVIAQETSEQLINSTGNTIKGTNHILEYTVGELSIATISGDDFSLTQGVLQPTVMVITANKSVMLPSISVYPNPVTDLVKIESSITVSEVVITSVSGVVYTRKNINNTMDLSELPAGIYFLDFKDQEHSSINLYKIIKL